MNSINYEVGVIMRPNFRNMLHGHKQLGKLLFTETKGSMNSTFTVYAGNQTHASIKSHIKNMRDSVLVLRVKPKKRNKVVRLAWDHAEEIYFDKHDSRLVVICFENSEDSRVFTVLLKKESVNYTKLSPK